MPLKSPGARHAAWLAAGAVIALLLAERLRPKRRRTQPVPARTLTNLALGASSLAVVPASSDRWHCGSAGASRRAGRGWRRRWAAPLGNAT